MNKKRGVAAWLVLTIIAAVAGLLLGVTNELTSAKIAERSAQELLSARQELMPEADGFNELTVEESDVLSCCEAVKGGEVLGHVVTVEATGFGGKIEVTVGVTSEGTVSGIRVGGSDFSETAGLGAKVKEEEFTSQFEGLVYPAVLKENVDSVTCASISSGAVVDAVNRAVEYTETLKVNTVDGVSDASDIIEEQEELK